MVTTAQSCKFRSGKKSGFTIIELLVTISIVVLVTGIVMVRYSSFNSSVLLTSQAYLTAFDLREAQSLAISVRGNSGGFREEYGLFFDTTNPGQYVLFQDNEDYGDHSPARYDAREQVATPYIVDPRFTILNICGTNSVSRTCTIDDPDTTGEVIDASFHNIAVSFKRPDFDARFYSPVKSGLQSVEIHIGSNDSEIIKSVVVYTSGQISIE